MKVFPISRKRYAWILENNARIVVDTAMSQPKRFTAFTETQSDSENCVITNGPNKSGTFLLHRIVDYLKKWEDISVRIETRRHITRNPQGEDSVQRCPAHISVGKLKNGQLVHAHLPWNAWLDKRMVQGTSKTRFKHLLILRDPRDTFVSRMRAEKWYMREKFSSDDDYLAHIIDLWKNYYFLDFMPWLNNPNCLAVRFEELYPELLDLEQGKIGNTVKSLIQYLGVDIASIDPTEFFHYVYGKSLTASAERNKVGQFRRMFNDNHYAQIDNPKFKNMLGAYGYEW